MITYLRDYANATTAVGYFFAVCALFFVLNGRVELGLAAIMWTWFLDHWDGLIARRTMQRRRPGFADFGKSFDGFVDFIHGVLFPAIVIIQMGNGSPLSFVASLALVLTGGIRLSYFENFGLTSDARFTGIPVSYDAPLLAILVLARPAIPTELFMPLLCGAFLLLSALHVNMSIRVPAIRGKAIPVATLLALIASFALAARA